MLRAFQATFAPSNVLAHVAKMTVGPRYVAHGAMGAGFAEVARAILAKR